MQDENIIIDQHSNLQRIDFGSAAWVREDKKFGTFCGTLDYCSPEVLLGQKYTGPPQDVWARKSKKNLVLSIVTYHSLLTIIVGILLYTLIYKENPYYNVDEIIDHPLRIPFILSKSRALRGWMEKTHFFVPSIDSVDLVRYILNRNETARPTIDQILSQPWFQT